MISPLFVFAPVALSINTMADRDLVMAALYDQGALYGRLTDEQEYKIRRFADGFGHGVFFAPPSTWDEQTTAMYYDWSSVRDSSEDAIEMMAYLLRKALA